MSSRILIANIDSHLPFTIYESIRVIGVLISDFMGFEVNIIWSDILED